MEQTMIEIRQMRQEAANLKISWTAENVHRSISWATENIHQAAENVHQANEELIKLIKLIKTQDETYGVITPKYKDESSIHTLNIMLNLALNTLNQIGESLNQIDEALDLINNNNQNE